MAGDLRVHRRPQLTRPVLIAAFRGWNDGAQAASLAAGYLAKTWEAERFADLDPENFFDFQATRPHVSLEDGVTRRIDWPETAFYHARPDGLDRDVVLLLGIEPNLRWRTFTELADRPRPRARRRDDDHPRRAARGRPAHATLAGDRERERRPTSSASSGSRRPATRARPASSGILHDACRQVDIPSASLWAAVPHYVSLTPSPRAAVALCERLGSLIGFEIDVDELEEAAQSYEEQVSEAVASDEETASYVEELERRVDSLEEEERELPSGDALAAELTRFLRERDEEDGDDAAREQ